MSTRPLPRRPAPLMAGLVAVAALALTGRGSEALAAGPPSPAAPSADGLDATVTVCPSGCDFTSIQPAVAAAQLGDTVFIGSGTYRETVTIDKSLTLRGVGPKVAIIDGNGQGPVITVRPGVGATISGLSVIGGRAASGAGIYNSGALNLSDCEVSGNATNSPTEGWGGGVFNYGGVMNVTACTIADNRGRLGGAIINAFGTLVLTNSRLTGNTAAKSGGALHNGVDASVRFDTVLLADNKVDAAEINGRGGGIFSAGFTYVSRSTFTGNYAPEFGGAVFQYQDTIILSNSTVSANTADVGGGAIYIAGGSMLVTNGTFVNNRGSFGAIWNNDKVTLRNSLLGNNPGGAASARSPRSATTSTAATRAASVPRVTSSTSTRGSGRWPTTAGSRPPTPSAPTARPWMPAIHSAAPRPTTRSSAPISAAPCARWTATATASNAATSGPTNTSRTRRTSRRRHRRRSPWRQAP